MANSISMFEGLLITVISMIVVFVVLMIIAAIIKLLENINGQDVINKSDTEELDPKIVAAIVASVSEFIEEERISHEMTAAMMGALKVHLRNERKTN